MFVITSDFNMPNMTMMFARRCCGSRINLGFKMSKNIFPMICHFYLETYEKILDMRGIGSISIT